MTSENMLYLANEYALGISVCCVVVCAFYLALSIVILVKARKAGLNVCASAMIPIYNLTIPIRVKALKMSRRRRAKKQRATNTNSEKTFEELGEDEEIQL